MYRRERTGVIRVRIFGAVGPRRAGDTRTAALQRAPEKEKRMRQLLGCLLATFLCTGVAIAQDKLDEPYVGTAAVSPFQQGEPQEALPIDDQFVDAITRAPCAGDVDINGAGTAGWTYTLNTYWHDRRTTSIYLASEFNCSNGGQINGIKYYVSAVPGMAMNALTIRLRHTTASSYASPYCFNNAGWTVCYQASTTITVTGWYTFTFTTPFMYNGLDNVEVDVSFDNTTYSGQGTIWAFTASATRTMYAYCDSCNGDPKLWTCGSPNPTVYGSTSVPRAKFVFPGGGPVGACCKPDGTCLPGLTQPECGAQGGIWMGEGTTCTPNNCPQPPVRCCLPNGECVMLPAPNCTAAGGVPGAYGTNCEPILNYNPSTCGNPFQDISATGTHVLAAEADDGGAAVPIGFTFTFFGVPQTSIGVTSNGYLTFGTVYGDYTPDPIPNPATPNDLIAVLWRDLNATGASVQYQTFGAAPNRWFIAQWTNVPCYSGCGPNTFQAVLYELDGCIELRYLLLDPAVSGYQAGVENSTGTVGVGVTGMVAPGACIRLCPGYLPPCPQPGACCFLDGSCQVMVQTACDALYGIFHGAGTTCDPNPCPPPCVMCPPEGVYENEPDCGPGYVDHFNGGCNSTPPVFSPIMCGETICGEGGTYLIGTGQYRDTDWCEYFTPVPTTFTWTAIATFPVQIFVIDGNNGCPTGGPTIIASAAAGACQPATITTACLAPGTYWFWVGTQTFTGVPCGSPYVAMLTCGPCPTGACCQPWGECVPDMNQVDCAEMGGSWQGVGTVCVPNPCIGACCFVGGGCQVLTPSQCSDAGGVYQGGGTDCLLNPCPQPGPDTCDLAELIPVPGLIYGHNRLATDDGTPYCGTSAPYKGVWYSVIGTGNTITVTTCSLKTLFDTKIQVFCDCPAVTCVAGNDDSCTLPGHNLNSTVSFCSEFGQTYYIVVGSYSSTTVGDFELIVSDDGLPCANPACPSPIGACCLPTGACVPQLTQARCMNLGGVSWHVGQGCFPTPCFPIDYYLDTTVQPPVGGGNGYPGPGAPGEWYPYPNFGWINQWWPNEFDLQRQKVVTITFDVEFPGGTAYMPVALNLATPEWTAQGLDRPPLPADVPTPELENLYIMRVPVEIITAPGHYSFGPITLPFCPAWISMDVQGGDFLLQGTIVHVCQGAPLTGACCFGSVCMPDMTEAHCTAQGGIWKGAGTHCFPSPCLPPPDYYFDPTGGQGGNGYQDQWYYYGNYNWWNMWWDNEFALDRHKLIHVSIDVWFPVQGAVTIALNWDTPAWTQLGLQRPPLPADVPTPALEDLYIGRQILETISWNQVPPYPQSGHFEFAFELPFCPDWISMDVQGGGYQVQGTITHICLPPSATGACCVGWDCSLQTAQACANLHGRYMGDGTTCDPNPCPINDVVVCEPQGVVNNPFHPPTYWYDVTPGNFGRCDFHVRVFDTDPADYTNVVSPPTWLFAVHQLPNGEWWASWWDPDCDNAIFNLFRFQFDNPHASTWGGWITTIGANNDPYDWQIDDWTHHAAEPDGYGYRVHVPSPNMPTGACCYLNGDCAITTEADCAGLWLGPGTTCDQCPPANDFCLTQMPVAEGVYNFDTTNATFDGPGWCMVGPNLWYCYVPTCSGAATISLAGSAYNTMLAVYHDCYCYPAQAMMMCCVPVQCTIAVQQGHGYLIEVGGIAGASGPGVLTITCNATGACCFAGSHCEILPADECTLAGGTFKGPGTTCDPNPCICRGDLNCDGLINFGDINPFVQILSNFQAWQTTYPGCPWQNGDINVDSTVSFGDINPFVAIMTSGQGPCQY
jgi:hypothetical protein